MIRDIDPYTCYKSHIVPEFRKSWDKKMTDVKIIEQNGEELKKYYIVKSTVPFIKDRDVVVREHHKENYPLPDHYTYAFTSCESDQYPETSNYIRASNHLTGYKFQPAPEVNGTWMEWVQNLDVNGDIPAIVFRKLGEKF